MSRSTLLFGGGESEVGRPGPRDTTLDDKLQTLSEKFVKAEPDFEPYSLPAHDDVAAIKEEILQWAGRVWSHLNEMPEGEELSTFDIMALEGKFRAYIEANGASLFDRGSSIDEIWCALQLAEGAPVLTFLSNKHSAAATDRVQPKYIESAETIVWLVAAISCFLQIKRPLLNVLVADGRTGHTLQLAGLNPVEYSHPRGVAVERGWFSFHDPWPARSLLAAERDFGDIAAIEDIARPPFWLLSPADLAKVVVGFMLPASMQADAEELLAIGRRLSSANADAGVPLWIEQPALPSMLFPVLSLTFGGTFGPEAPTLLGLAQWALMNGDVETAEERFEAASRFDPMEAAGAANQLYHRFGHTDLARQWYRRLFGG